MRRRDLLWRCGILAAAFGVVEAAVVVYLRALYYPNGFAFPLAAIPPAILKLEIVREAATIVLLLAVSGLAARRPIHRFAVFAYTFAVWDLVYYLALKIALDWPESVLDWDVLFLIPLPWLGPVLAPVLVSLCLVAAAVLILGRHEGKGLPPRVWLVEIAAGLAIIGTFLANTGTVARGEVPTHFPWVIFGVALVGGVTYFAWAWRRL